ncbi:hypothetical protein [uncultured Nostoc sp.]|uniref:hypothetical protein n=1 Tax=uncultured Nostoc sp. TaxID=340711 RepID=UPI0035CA75F0
MEADEILSSASLVNRHLYQKKITDTAEAQLEQSQPTNYLNFDANTGLARLQDVSGNIIYGAAQTNGALGKGESIRLRRGGVLGGYDSMPHHKMQPSPSNPPSKDFLDAAILFMIRAGYARSNLEFYSKTFYFPHPIQRQVSQNCNVVTQPTQSIVFEDTFLFEFGSGGFLDSFFFSYNQYSTGENTHLSAIKFVSPTSSVITIEVSFSPGGGVIDTYCGVSVDRFTNYTYAQYVEPGNQLPSTIIELDTSTCDAYSSGTSISYTTTVAAGTHFVSLIAGYNYRYDVQSSTADGVLYTETVTGDIKITIETIALASFYIQQGKIATKIADLNIADYTLISGDPAVLTGSYLTYAKSEIIAHLKTKTYVSSSPVVHRYLLSGTQVTELDFAPPQTIPALNDDWQNPWTTSYYPELTSEDACINSARSGAVANFTNFYKNNIIVCSQQSTDQSPVAFTAIINQDFNAQFQINSYNSQNNTCTLSNGKKKNIKLRQLVIDPGINLSFVQILAVSPFYSS